jgi:uncharacterized protein YlbG (UPF0298 family)
MGIIMLIKTDKQTRRVIKYGKFVYLKKEGGK